MADEGVYTRVSSWVDGRIVMGAASLNTQAAQRGLLGFQEELRGRYAYEDVVRRGVEAVLDPADLARLDELQHAYDASAAEDRAGAETAVRARRAETAERLRDALDSGEAVMTSALAEYGIPLPASATPVLRPGGFGAPPWANLRKDETMPSERMEEDAPPATGAVRVSGDMEWTDADDARPPLKHPLCRAALCGITDCGKPGPCFVDVPAGVRP